jgi:glycosyltransferase involved in cell wall biosynthesis
VSRRRPLRVAFVTGALYTGGAERGMLALVRGLPRDRFEVEMVLLTEAGPAAAAFEEAGARIRVLGWGRRKNRLHFLRWMWDVARLGPELRRGRYDIVDAWLFHAYAVTALVKPISGAPVLLSGRHFMTEGQPHMGPIERFLDALARRRSDAVVAVGEAVRDDAILHEHLDPGRIRVIHSGVIMPPPMAPPERAAIRAGWGFGPGDLVVGGVANYKPRKGIELVLRAAAALRRRTPNLRFVFVGEGTHRPVIEALVAELGVGDIVRLHGRELDARRLYGAFDVFAHASETEGAPNAVIEAAAAGLPILATRAGGTCDVVDDGESGLLVPVGDEAAFSAGLSRLAGDPALRARLGAAARQRVAAAFSMDRMVAEYAALYEELAERKGLRR